MAVDTTPATFTLGDLLDHDLGLELLVGGDEARRRKVAGAHVIEIEHPATWLERDWIMLTTGVRLRHSAEAQRDLVAELKDAGVAALGFGVEVVFKRVPPALREEADRLELPVFEIPLRVPFREIVGAVQSSLLSSEVRSLQRLSSLELYLMDALSEPDPRTAVLERLSSFVEAPVTLFSPGGEVIAATGATPTAEVWAKVAEHPTALVQFEHGGWSTIATPVQLGPGAPGWLAVSTDRTPSTTRLTRAAARATAPVLAALGRLDGLAEGQVRAMRAALLDELLDADLADSARLAAQASSLGFDLETRARMLYVAQPTGSGDRRSDGELAAARESLEQVLEATRCQHLVGRRGERVAALVQLELDELRSAATEALAGHPGLTAGIGRGTVGVEDVRVSLRDAEVAAQRAASAGDPPVLAFDDFDLATLMVTAADSERLEPKIEELLCELEKNPMILEAVRAYFEHDLDVMSTAEALHLHHNSLRYRLGRAEQFLGHSLKEPATIASLYLALTARSAH